jgi:hypothetical protein
LKIFDFCDFFRGKAANGANINNLKYYVFRGGLLLKAIIFGLAAVFCYGFMVGIQSLIGMFRYDKSCWPLACGYLGYFILIPLTLFIPGLYPTFSNGVVDVENHSLWKVCFLLFLIIMWLILGFCIKASYQRIITGETYWKPKKVARKRILIGLGSALVGGIIWLVGLTGHLNFLTGWWEKSTIILSLYLLVQGIILILRNMKYMLKDQPKEHVKTVESGSRAAKKAAKKSGKPEYQHISYKGQKKQKVTK